MPNPLSYRSPNPKLHIYSLMRPGTIFTALDHTTSPNVCMCAVEPHGLLWVQETNWINWMKHSGHWPTTIKIILLLLTIIPISKQHHLHYLLKLLLPNHPIIFCPGIICHTMQWRWNRYVPPVKFSLYILFLQREKKSLWFIPE